jgi:hypothetical protein
MSNRFPINLTELLLDATEDASPTAVADALATWRNQGKEHWAGKKIYSRRGGDCGVASGHTKVCRLGGCPGMRIMVRWPDGTRTWPCSEGLMAHGDGYQIM